MIGPYPFFGFPPFRRPYPYYPNVSHLHSAHEFSANKTKDACFPNHLANKQQGDFVHSSPSFKQAKKQNYDMVKEENIEEQREECFEIFGLKLYFDDLLLIALLFFLYQEEVKDTYLYIALVLLLLS